MPPFRKKKRGTKTSSCSCPVILDEIQQLDLFHRSTVKKAEEIDAFFGGLVYYDIAMAVREILEKHKAVFSKCSCATARHLRRIYIVPAIQESDPDLRMPISNEYFFVFQKALWKGGERVSDQESPEAKTQECPGCGCKVEVKEGEEVSCPCCKDCECCTEEAGCSCSQPSS